ncbi:MAG: VPLPA-CTERM sorting domain-containing protein [Marinibacterium sp.]
MYRMRTAWAVFCLALGLGLVAGGAVRAATVTVDEAALDAIFAQASFGSTPIDVRVAPTQVLVAPDFLDIDSPTKSYDLLNTARPGPQIDMFYVDSITACGNQTGIAFAGCGWVGQGGLYLDSFWAASSYGAELTAHEMAHNLGLPHSHGGLMNPTLNFDVTLTGAEAATILASPLVQSDANGLFVEVVPWVVTGVSAVPLPASGVLLLAGIGALAAVRRRKGRPGPAV